ncbi:hypothetical protein [Brevibacterium album]|uniref:hypothetical protein n=1 Tax=Brevibacterium album TaxID=417948 RepID=UPI0004205C1B|nr:hypothetical protein [Brevibacterium album]
MAAQHPWRALWKEHCARRVPVYRVLVPDSVPDSVLAVWDARGYPVSASRQTGAVRLLASPGEARNLIRSNILFKGLTGAGAGVTGITGLSAFGVSWITGDIATGGFVATGILAAGTGVTGGLTGSKYLRDPKRLSRADRQRARQARWITPVSLGYLGGGKKGQDTDEQRLFQLAVTIATRIAATRSWTHPVLADHVARVDLDAIIGTLGTRLVELCEVRSQLDELRDTGEADRVSAYLRRLAGAFSSIADRVVSMHEYLEHLRSLDAQLIALDHSERTREMGERVLDVVARTAGDETVEGHFRDLNLEAESHADSIRQLLGELDETAEEFDDLDSRIAQAVRQLPEEASLPTVEELGGSSAQRRSAEHER